MRNLTDTFCLTIAVLLGSVGVAQAEGFDEFICKNFQTLNVDDAG